MTHTDILQSSLLDLLFERRNKQYGAYILRKYYENRLALALGLTLGAVFLSALVFDGFNGATHREEAPSTKVVELSALPTVPDVPEPPKEVQPRAQRSAQTADFTNKIVITNGPTDVATVDRVAVSVVGSEDLEGPVATPDIHVAAAPVSTGTAAPAPAPEAPPAAAGPTVEPSFPGGMAAWLRYLQVNLREPSDLAPGEKRTVRVRFWVGEDGAVSRFEIEQSGGASYDAEVLRVLKRMGRWNPALQNGRAVATSFVQPVTFMAHDEE